MKFSDLSNPLSAVSGFFSSAKTEETATPSTPPSAPATTTTAIPANNRGGDRRIGMNLLSAFTASLKKLQDSLMASGKVDDKIASDGESMAEDVTARLSKPATDGDAPAAAKGRTAAGEETPGAGADKPAGSPALPQPAGPAPATTTVTPAATVTPATIPVTPAQPTPTPEKALQNKIAELEATVDDLNAHIAATVTRTPDPAGSARTLHVGMNKFNHMMSSITSKMLDTSHIGALETQLEQLEKEIAEGGGTPSREQLAKRALLDQAITSSIERLIALMQRMCQIMKTADDNASRLLS